MSRVQSFYLAFGGLMALLALTVGLSFVHLGPWNDVVAFGIGGVKAMLVVLFFMEVRWGTVLVRVFFGATLLWLGILIVGTMHDYGTRAPLPFPLW